MPQRPLGVVLAHFGLREVGLGPLRTRSSIVGPLAASQRAFLARGLYGFPGLELGFEGFYSRNLAKWLILFTCCHSGQKTAYGFALGPQDLPGRLP